VTPEELQHALRRIIASFSAAELAVFAAVALAVKQQRSPATVRQRVRKLVSDLRSGVSDDVGAVLLAAYGIGFAKSVKEAQEVPRLARIVTHFKEPSLEAIAKLQAEYEHSVDAAAVRILRYADDVYRDVIAQATTKGLEGMAGEATRLKTAQAALDSFASRGVIVFDSSGRTMNLVSYVEMATRTATMNAERAASLAGYAALGEDLVFINDSASACPAPATTPPTSRSTTPRQKASSTPTANTRRRSTSRASPRCPMPTWPTLSATRPSNSSATSSAAFAPGRCAPLLPSMNRHRRVPPPRSRNGRAACDRTWRPTIYRVSTDANQSLDPASPRRAIA